MVVIVIYITTVTTIIILSCNDDIDNGYITYHVRYVYLQDDDDTPVRLVSPYSGEEDIRCLPRINQDQ
jgi:hypothetical protein